VEVGPGVTKARAGDFVLLSFHNCKDCHDCKEDHPSFCSKFTEVNYGGEDATYTAEGSDLRGNFFGQSSFAELAVVKETSVVNVTNIIETEEELKLFAPLGCGFQTGAATVENVAKANEKDRIAVIGLGGVGLVSIMVRDDAQEREGQANGSSRQQRCRLARLSSVLIAYRRD
jgi:Zn-dependent alcohol dehydrogenase